MPKSDMPDFTWSRKLTRDIIDIDWEEIDVPEDVRKAMEELTNKLDEAQGEVEGDVVIIRVLGGALP
jgi:hypothetical protein